MRISLKLVPFIASIGLIALFRCSTTSVTGNLSQTGNAFAKGSLYKTDGSPAVNATVRLMKVNYNPCYQQGMTVDDIYISLTDQNGEYVLDTMPAGYYAILGERDGTLSFQDSVLVQSQSVLPPDTLKAPGTLRGIVRLQGGDDNRRVYIVVLGTPRYIIPQDTVGHFNLSAMAEGTYRVRFIPTLNGYQIFDTMLTIRSGQIDTLSDTIYLKPTGIPAPANLRLSYDSLFQRVTLQWDSVDATLLLGYRVYRKSSNLDYKVLAPNLLHTEGYNDNFVSETQYEYQVVAVSKDSTESRKSNRAIVYAKGPFPLLETIAPPYPHVIGSDFCVGSTGEIFFADNHFYYYDSLRRHDCHLIRYVPSTNTIIPIKSCSTYVTRIAVDSKNNVYAINQPFNSGIRISKYSPSGALLLEFNSIKDPTVIAIDSGDNVFVTQSTSNKLFRFDTAGTLLDSIDLSARKLLTDPQCIGLGPENTVCVWWPCRTVYRINYAMELIDSFKVAGAPARGWLTYDSNGNIYAPYGGQLGMANAKIDANKNVVALYHRSGSGVYPEYDPPRSVCVGNRLYSLIDNGEINVYDIGN